MITLKEELNWKSLVERFTLCPPVGQLRGAKEYLLLLLAEREKGSLMDEDTAYLMSFVSVLEASDSNSRLSRIKDLCLELELPRSNPAYMDSWSELVQQVQNL